MKEMFLARVPIYGIGDSGRQFWKRLREEFLKVESHAYGVPRKPMILAVFLVDVEFSRFRTFANEFPLSVHFGSKFTHINEDPKSWEG